MGIDANDYFIKREIILPKIIHGYFEITMNINDININESNYELPPR